MLAPGFRVGWMKAPEVLIERFDTAKQSTDLTSGILDQHIVHEALRRALRIDSRHSLRDLYRHKRDVMAQAIGARLGSRLTWPTPKGGFFIWATLPDGCTDSELLERALQHGVIFVVGSAFHVDGSGTTRSVVVLGTLPERIEEGARRLADAFG